MGCLGNYIQFLVRKHTLLRRKRRIMSASTGCRCSCCNQTGSHCSLEISVKFILVFLRQSSLLLISSLRWVEFVCTYIPYPFYRFTVRLIAWLRQRATLCVCEWTVSTGASTNMMVCCLPSLLFVKRAQTELLTQCADYQPHNRCFYSLWDYNISGLLPQHINT